MITLLDKAILIELYCIPNVARRAPRAPGEQRSLDRLFNAGLLNGGQEVTEKGKVLCEAIRNVLMPEQKWVMP